MSSSVNRNYTNRGLVALTNASLQHSVPRWMITIAYRRTFPIANDPTEKRAAAGINIWLIVSIISGIAFPACTCSGRGRPSSTAMRVLESHYVPHCLA